MGLTQKGLIEYYARRAPEYDHIYEKPERQKDLATLKDWVRAEMAGRRVLEIACGTGYWTAAIADAASSVLATDAGSEVLDIARQRLRPRLDKVPFERLDACALGDMRGRFDAVFAGFWWSHLPRQLVPDFLRGLRASVGDGVRAVFIDNRFVPGSNLPIVETDGFGNAYQMRRLDDGSEFRIVKNFPGPEELRTAVSGCGAAFSVRELEHYWMLSFEMRRAS